MKYQAPREAKERDTEEENAHPFSLNYSTFIKHSDVQPDWEIGVGWQEAEIYSTGLEFSVSRDD